MVWIFDLRNEIRYAFRFALSRVNFDLTDVNKLIH